MALRHRLRIAAAAAALTALPIACGIPRDPEGTLERVTDGTLRVGIAHEPPWTDISAASPRGIEVQLVEGFARTIGAEIEWAEGSVEELAAAAHLGELDLVIGGLTGDSTLSSEIALTHPYLTTQVVIAVPAGDQVPEDIAGLEVAVEEHTEAAGILAKTDAEVVRVEDVAEVTSAVAVDSFLVDDLGLVDTGVRLSESDHAFGARHGENAFIVRVERFLLNNPELVAAAVEENDEL